MKLPILFFPGIMASRLYFPNSRLYWDPDSNLRMVRWVPQRPFRSDEDNRRQMHFLEPAGVIVESVSGHPDGESLGWSGVMWSCYGSYLSVLQELAANGRAFAVGYDWRQDLRWLGDYAADKIRLALDATGAAQVALVGHSMGGLVIRAALRAAPDLAGRIARVLFVCQPAVGAVILYRRLFTGLVRGLDGGGRIFDRVFRFILGNTRAGFVGNMSGLPGAMDLLPSGSFPTDSDGTHWHSAMDGGLAFADLYPNANSPPGLNAINSHPDPAVRADFKDRVEEVMEVGDWLGPPQLERAIDVWQILGVGLETELGVAFDGATPMPRRGDLGDAVVPPLSARAMQTTPDRTFEAPQVDHADACKNETVAAITRRALL